MNVSMMPKFSTILKDTNTLNIVATINGVFRFEQSAYTTHRFWILHESQSYKIQLNEIAVTPLSPALCYIWTDKGGFFKSCPLF